MSETTRRHGFDRIDPEKRATLRKLAAGAAFVAPVVLSFPLSGLSITDARAYVTTSDENPNLLPIPGDPSDNTTANRGGGGQGRPDSSPIPKGKAPGR